MANIKETKRNIEELEAEGYRLIVANYSGICTECSEPYIAGARIYWKRDDSRTLVVCPKCYGGDETPVFQQKITQTLVCPHCGKPIKVELKS